MLYSRHYVYEKKLNTLSFQSYFDSFVFLIKYIFCFAFTYKDWRGDVEFW